MRTKEDSAEILYGEKTARRGLEKIWTTYNDTVYFSSGPDYCTAGRL